MKIPPFSFLSKIVY